MTLPKIDTFEVEADQRIYEYNASWKENNGSQWQLLELTDDVKVSLQGTNAEDGCHWEGDIFNANQYAQIKISALDTNGIGAAVRVAAGATGTYYVFYCSSSDHFLGKLVDGTFTQIGSTDTTNGAAGEIIRLEVVGNVLTPKINGEVWGQGNQTNDSIPSGYAGMSGWGNSAFVRADDFEGGDLGEECNTVVIVEVNTVQAPVITRTTVVMQG